MEHKRNLVRGKLVSKLALVFIVSFCSSSFAADPLDDLQPGEWYEVPNSKLYDVRPDGWSANVVVPWSGGAYDTKRDRLVIWGGGHLDYAGNEVYVFDVNTLAWERLTDPSTDLGGDEGSGLYPDGLPRARHTYDYVEYAPNIDKFLVFGGNAQYPTASVASGKVLAFDFDTLTWDSTLAEVPLGYGTAGTASYNPADGKVWYNPLIGTDSQLQRYDPVADSWDVYAEGDAVLYSVSAIDPTRNIMVTIGGYNGTKQMFKWDLSNPGAPPVDLLDVTTGPINLVDDVAPGFVYDPVSDKFVAWGGAVDSWGPSADVFTLDPDTWAWTKSTPAATNTVIPTKPAGDAYITGTYGRFQYMPSFNAFILVNSRDENVFIYKLAADPSSSADFDGDNDVDGADFLTWQRGFGIAAGATPSQGDANLDGAIDAQDFEVWQAQFGDVTATSAAVPEPSTLLLGLMGVGMLSLMYSRR